MHTHPLHVWSPRTLTRAPSYRSDIVYPYPLSRFSRPPPEQGARPDKLRAQAVSTPNVLKVAPNIEYFSVGGEIWPSYVGTPNVHIPRLTTLRFRRVKSRATPRRRRRPRAGGDSLYSEKWKTGRSLGACSCSVSCRVLHVVGIVAQCSICLFSPFGRQLCARQKADALVPCLHNPKWSFPAEAASIRSLTHLDFQGIFPGDSHAFADILANGHQLESLRLECHLERAASTQFRERPTALPFLHHFAFRGDVVSAAGGPGADPAGTGSREHPRGCLGTSVVPFISRCVAPSKPPLPLQIGCW